MNCIRCEKEMKKVTMSGDISGMPVYLKHKEKGILGAEKTSSVECYVCTKCGHIELIATKPEVFR